MGKKAIVGSLKCDELCALKSRKELKKGLESKKHREQIEDALQENLCGDCFG